MPLPGKNPCHWLPPSPQSAAAEGLSREGGPWQQVPPPSHPKRPGSGTTEGQLWAVVHWPRLAPRSPARPLLGWARPRLPRTRGEQHGQAGQHSERGRVGPALATPGRSVCSPRAVEPHSPMSRQCHCPRGATPPAACPLCQSRCRVWCRALSPPPGAGLARPPLPSTRSPGRSFADF